MKDQYSQEMERLDRAIGDEAAERDKRQQRKQQQAEAARKDKKPCPLDAAGWCDYMNCHRASAYDDRRVGHMPDGSTVVMDGGTGRKWLCRDRHYRPCPIGAPDEATAEEWTARTKAAHDERVAEAAEKRAALHAKRKQLRAERDAAIERERRAHIQEQIAAGNPPKAPTHDLEIRV